MGTQTGGSTVVLLSDKTTLCSQNSSTAVLRELNTMRCAEVTIQQRLSPCCLGSNRHLSASVIIPANVKRKEKKSPTVL